MKSISTKISAQNASAKRNGNSWRNFVASLVVAGVATVGMAQTGGMNFEIDNTLTGWTSISEVHKIPALEDLRLDYIGTKEDGDDYTPQLNINFKNDDRSLTDTIKFQPASSGHILVLSATGATNNSATISPTNSTNKHGFLSVTGDVALQVTNGSTITISGFDAGSSADGGAIFSTSKITLGTAENNGTLIFDGNKARSGGAIYGEDAIAVNGNNTFTGNTADYGGAIARNIMSAQNIQNVTISGKNTFTNNEAKTGSGGAIYNEGGKVIVSGATTFDSNSAKADGGAIFVDGAAEITGATFDKNTANQGGALAIFYTNSHYTGEDFKALENQNVITDSSFTDNSADTLGGAIYTQHGITIVASEKDIVFSGNKANNINNDIFLANGADLTLNAAETHTITFGGGIVSENNGSNVTVTGGRVILGSGSINAITGNILVENTSVLEVIQGAKFTAPPTNLTLDNGTFRVVGTNFEKDETLIGDWAPMPIVLGNSGGTIDIKTTTGNYDLTLTAGGGITGGNALTITNSADLNATPNIGKLILDADTVNTVGALKVKTNAALENQGTLTANGATISGANSLLILAAGSTNIISGKVDVNAGGVVEIVRGADISGCAGVEELVLNKGTLRLVGAGKDSALLPITLGTGGGTIDVKNDGGDYTVTNYSGITGTGSLTKTGDGTLVLTGTNNYDGATTVNGGTLKIASGAKFAKKGDAIVNGATSILELQDEIDFDGTTNKELTLKDGGTLALTGGGNVSSALAITLEGDAGGKVDVASSMTATASDVISGTKLTKTGAGNLTLSGANTYNGATIISAGTLEVTGSLGGGTYAGNIANAGTLKMNQTTAQTLSGVISGAGSLVKDGSSTLTLSGANTYSGDTTVTAGTLNITGTLITDGAVDVKDGATLGLMVDNSTPTISAESVDFNTTGKLNITGYTSGTELGDSQTVITTTAGVENFNSAVTIGGAASVDFLSASAKLANDDNDVVVETSLTWNSTDPNREAHGNFTIDDNNTFTLGAALENNDASTNRAAGWDGKSLTKKGDGTLVLADANTYTGGTKIEDGTLEVTGSLGTNGNYAGNIANAGTLKINQGTGVTQTLSGGITGGGSLKKDGGGTLNVLGGMDVGAFTASGGKTVLGSNDLAATKTTYKATSTTVNSSTLTIRGGDYALGAISVANSGRFEIENGARSINPIDNMSLSLNNGTFAITGDYTQADKDKNGMDIALAINLAGAGTYEVSAKDGATTPVYAIVKQTGAITGSGNAFTKTGAGKLNLLGGMNVGAFTTGGGKTVLGDNNAETSQTYRAASTAVNDSTLQLQGGKYNLGSIIVNNAGTLDIHNGARGIGLADSITSVNLTLNGGTLAFTGDYTQADKTNSGMDSPFAITLGASGGTYDVSANDGAITPIFTNVKQTGIISGSGSLTKTGAGNLTLTGANSYTGKTIVSAGTLTVGSGGSLIVTATKEQANAQIILAKDTTLAVASGGTLKVNAKDADLIGLTAGQSEKFYFAKGAASDSIGTLDIKGTVDCSGISNFVYNTSTYATNYGTNEMFVNVTRKSAKEIKHVSSSVAQVLASYKGGNSFLDNVIGSPSGNESSDAERVELGFNSSGAAGVGNSLANVAGAFRGGVHQQLAGTAAAYTIGGGNGISGQAKRGSSFIERSIWVAPTYGHQQATSLSSGDGTNTFGYTADQYALAFGAEARQGRFKFGVAAQLGGGITTSTDTRVVRTNSDSFFGGLGIYSTTPVTCYVDLVSQLGWVGTSNKLEQNNANSNLSADVMGGLVFYSIGFEKKVYFGRAYMTPLVGFDYGFVYQNAYDTLEQGTGATVMKSKFGSAHMVTLPIGLRLGYDIKNKGTTFTPEVSARCLPNVGDYELPYEATPTGATAAKLRSLVSDRVAGDAAIGLNWRSARNELGVRYGLLFSEHFTNQDATFMYRRKF